MKSKITRYEKVDHPLYLCISVFEFGSGATDDHAAMHAVCGAA
jgi:hypothetical protein